jgi:hypothetical protein
MASVRLQDRVAPGWFSKMDARTVEKTAEVRKQAEAELATISTIPALPNSLLGLNTGPAFQVASAKCVRDSSSSSSCSCWSCLMPNYLPNFSDSDFHLVSLVVVQCCSAVTLYASSACPVSPCICSSTEAQPLAGALTQSLNNQHLLILPQLCAGEPYESVGGCVLRSKARPARGETAGMGVDSHLDPVLDFH